MNTRLSLSAWLMASCMLAGCQGHDARPSGTEPVGVKSVVVGAASVSGGGSYSGTVEEENGTALSFANAGTVQAIHVHLGQRVAKGQLIATLDPTDMQSSHNATRAALLQAEDAYKRMKELHDKGSLPDIKWVEVQSQVEQARSMEQLAAKRLGDCKLYAPFAGVIADKAMEVGQNVMPGAPVARLVTASLLRVKISVPEAEVSGVAIGQQARVTVPALSGMALDGEVVEKGIVAHPLSRSYDVKLRVDGAGGKLMPGMVAEVTLASPQGSQACVIPANIVQLDEHNHTFVWVVSDGKAERRTVACGQFVGDGVVVTQGLTAGERLIVEGQHKVCSGTPVKEM